VRPLVAANGRAPGTLIVGRYAMQATPGRQATGASERTIWRRRAGPVPERRCAVSVPEDGSAGGAGAGLVVPGVGGMRAFRLGRWLSHRSRRLADASGSSGARRAPRSGPRHFSGGRRGLARCNRLRGSRPCGDGGLVRVRVGGGSISHVVAQRRAEYLPAPLSAGPPRELGPRQHLVYPRGVSLGDLKSHGDPG
jgi:hypothetical protein